MTSKMVLLSNIIFNASMVTIPVMLLAGCSLLTREEPLVNKNSPVALQLTEAQAQSKLNCKETKGTILSEQVVQQRLFHDVTVFKINVKGCGKEAVYVTRCDDEKKPFCEVQLQSNDGK
ncbi:MAG: hypothetical protein ACXV8P_11550 [Methylobacter sp.]